MPRGSNRGGRNNNPTGRNQYSDWGVTDLVRERPVAAAAAAAGAAAAGLFLWSKRAQISQQLSSLSDQISDWAESMNFGGGDEFGASDDTAGLTTTGEANTGSTTSRRGRSRSTGRGRGMSETGGGNANLGARSGGTGTTSPSGRGPAQSTPTT
jgi:hypothetical protein